MFCNIINSLLRKQYIQLQVLPGADARKNKESFPSPIVKSKLKLTLRSRPTRVVSQTFSYWNNWSRSGVVLLQRLRWRCVDCVFHHERDVREEQQYIYLARTSNDRVIPMEWSWWVTSNIACESGEQLAVRANRDDESDLVGWSLLLLAATVRSFAHMPLGISDRNTIHIPQ